MPRTRCNSTGILYETAYDLGMVGGKHFTCIVTVWRFSFIADPKGLFRHEPGVFLRVQSAVFRNGRSVGSRPRVYETVEDAGAADRVCAERDRRVAEARKRFAKKYGA